MHEFFNSLFRGFRKPKFEQSAGELFIPHHRRLSLTESMIIATSAGDFNRGLDELVMRNALGMTVDEFNKLANMDDTHDS